MDDLAAADYHVQLPREGDKHCTEVSPRQLGSGDVIDAVPHIVYNRLVTIRALPQRWAQVRGMHSRVRFVAEPGGEEMDAASYSFKRSKAFPNCDSKGRVTVKVRFDSKVSYYRCKKLYYVEFIWDADEEAGLERLAVRSEKPICVTRAPAKRKAVAPAPAPEAVEDRPSKKTKELEEKVEALQGDMDVIKGMLHKIMEMQTSSQGFSWPAELF
jgi:hypothetical protein